MYKNIQKSSVIKIHVLVPYPLSIIPTSFNFNTQYETESIIATSVLSISFCLFLNRWKIIGQIHVRTTIKIEDNNLYISFHGKTCIDTCFRDPAFSRLVENEDNRFLICHQRCIQTKCRNNCRFTLNIYGILTKLPSHYDHMVFLNDSFALFDGGILPQTFIWWQCGWSWYQIKQKYIILYETHIYVFIETLCVWKFSSCS